MIHREPIFTTVRAMLGRGFTQAEVDELDEAIDAALGTRVSLPDAPGEAEKDFTPAYIGDAGIALIKDFEGCHRIRGDGMVEAYPDPGTGGDPWTIGWGSTGKGIEPGTVWTKDQCDERFERDLTRYADDVIRALGDAIHHTSQAQFDALVSFHYNTGAIARATLTARHRAGDFTGAADEFDRWVFAGGRRMRGLERRRKAEAELYRSGT